MEWTTDNREWYRTVYLNSDHWKSLRRTKLADKHSCEMCGREDHLDVHHINYRNIFDVTLPDLLTVCRPCHKQVHEMVPPEKRIKEGFRASNGPEYSERNLTNPPLVGMVAMVVIFGHECLVCSCSINAFNVGRFPLPNRDDGERWRLGVPLCPKCSKRPLTELDVQKAWDFIALLPTHAVAEAFRFGQEVRNKIVRENRWQYSISKQTAYLERALVASNYS